MAGAVLFISISLSLAAAQVPSQKNSQTQISGDQQDARITITVVGQAGALIPDAQIVVTEEPDNKKIEGIANLHGELDLTGLAAGRYMVIIREQGFMDHREIVTLREHQTLTLKAELAAWMEPSCCPPPLETIDMDIPEPTAIPLVPLMPLPIPRQKHRLPFFWHRGKNPT